LRKSFPEIDINQPECPFCNAPQPLAPGAVSTEHGLRQHCDCQQMQEYLRQNRVLNDLKDQLMIAKQREDYQKKRAEKLLAESGIGKRFLAATFENYERQRMPKAYDIALGYVEEFDSNDGQGLLFTGDVGTGKTHLAAAIAGEIIRKYSATVEFVSYVEVLADIRAAFSAHSYEAHRLEERMRKAQLLVIDDLGKEKSSTFTNEFIYRVVNGRYKDKLPLIITSNYGAETLSERLDYSTFSRIVDQCKVVEMRGIDYRMKDYLC
jgi:DNA replication protein DnaC